MFINLLIVNKLIPLQLHEAIEDAEDQRRQLSAAKKKAQRLAAEMQDTKLHLEEQMSRNNDLERKQRRWESTNFINTLSLYCNDHPFCLTKSFENQTINGICTVLTICYILHSFWILEEKNFKEYV